MPAFRIGNAIKVHGSYLVLARWRFVEQGADKCPFCNSDNNAVFMKVYAERKSGYLWQRCDLCLFCLPKCWLLSRPDGRRIGDATENLIAERRAWLAGLPARLIAKIEVSW